MDSQTKEAKIPADGDEASLQGQVNPLEVSVETKSSPSDSAEKKEDNSSKSSIFIENEEEKAQSSDPAEAKTDGSKKKYQNIPNDIRLKLIDAVENKGMKIKHAAKKFGINYSSAKSICQVYKKEGRTKKMLIKKRMHNPELTSENQNQSIGPHFTVYNQQEQNYTLNHHLYKKEMEDPNDPNDNLTKLKNRLLQNRNNNNTQLERVDLPPYKKLHHSGDTVGETNQLEHLDKVIAQNTQLLNSKGGESMMSNSGNSTTVVNNNCVVQNVTTGGQGQQMLTMSPLQGNYQGGKQPVYQMAVNNGENQIGGYMMINPQNGSVRQQQQVQTQPQQQQVFMTPYPGQVQYVMNPIQNSYPQQQGYLNYGTPVPQQFGNEMIVLMAPPNQQNNQPYYMSSPMDGKGTPQQQQPQQVMMQMPQYIPVYPNGQPVNNMPQPSFQQPQFQQNGGITYVQAPQNGQIAYIQPQPQMQQPVYYVMPGGNNMISQNPNGPQSYVYANPRIRMPMQVTTNSNPQQTQTQSTNQEPQSTENNETKSNEMAKMSTVPIQIQTATPSKLAEKMEVVDQGTLTKKVVFDSTPKPRLVSDLLNELKTNPSNTNEKWLGLKVLMQQSNPE